MQTAFCTFRQKIKERAKNSLLKYRRQQNFQKNDIDKYVKEAEQYASEDVKRKEEIEVRNEADNLIYSVEKSLKDHGDKISADERLTIEQSLTAAKDALKGSDVAAIKSTKETLTTASHKLAEAVYKASQAQGAQGAAQGNQQQGQSQGDSQQTAGNGGKVVDAEVVDENKNNK